MLDCRFSKLRNILYLIPKRKVFERISRLAREFFLNEYQNFLTESITLNDDDIECQSHLPKSYDLIINFYGICLMLVALNHLNNTQSQIHLSIPTP